MRVIRLRHPAGLDSLVVDTAPVPAVGPGEIRVRLHASSLNYHDLMVVKGLMAAQDGLIPMSDGAGEVVEVGEGVTEFASGDRVVSTFFPLWRSGKPDPQAMAFLPGDRVDGYAREEVVTIASAFSRAPKGYSHAEAATLTCAGLTAWRALFVEAHVTPGDTVLVQGTGGVSLFALQFAKAAGATVIATSSSDEKLERLRSLGADHLINYRSQPKWGAAAREMTDGRGVDHVIEIAGDFNQSVAACAVSGHIALVAMLAGNTHKFPFFAMIGKSVRITGLSVGNRDQHLAMIRAIDVNGIKPVIGSRFPLEAIADAFRLQESAQHFGKISLEW